MTTAALVAAESNGGISMLQLALAAIGIVGSLAGLALKGFFDLKSQNTAQHAAGLSASGDVKNGIDALGAELRTSMSQVRRDLSGLAERVDHNQQMAEQQRAEILAQVSRRRSTDQQPEEQA